MSYMKPPGQLDLSDRLAIEVGICNGDSFKKIIVVRDLVKVRRNDRGIVTIGIRNFLLD